MKKISLPETKYRQLMRRDKQIIKAKRIAQELWSILAPVKKVEAVEKLRKQIRKEKSKI